MTFALHELSLNQDIQEKCRANILEVLEKHEGKITYEALSEMTYLERCINGLLNQLDIKYCKLTFTCLLKESLRKFPPAANLIRTVTKDYHVPDSNVILKKGTVVFVSAYGIHHDSDIYENPEQFNPERFLPENTSKRHPMAFMPFGQGSLII